VLSLIGLICAAVFPGQGYRGFGWVTFVLVTGFIHCTLSFVLHILNFFPEMTLAYIIVRLLLIAVYTEYRRICSIS